MRCITEDHDLVEEFVAGELFRNFYCREKEEACAIKHGYDFDYCPFCSKEVNIKA